MPTLKIMELVEMYDSLFECWALRSNPEEGDVHTPDSFMMYMAKDIVEIAWHNLGGKAKRLSFYRKPILAPLLKQYTEQGKIKNQKINSYIIKNIENYVHRFRIDFHVNIDSKLIACIECEMRTKNVTVKHIAKDSVFLKQAHPKAINVLFQLESQLGGDYGNIKKNVHYGSNPTHTILSYFDDVDLNIVTLLEGERKVDQPIHKKKFYKPLETTSVKRAVKVFEDLLMPSL